MSNLEPLAVAWHVADWIGANGGWAVKAFSALFIGIGLQLLPKPPGWVALSRAGVLIGGMLLALSVLSPINAFGPLGDFVFYPSMALNVGGLLWNRRHIVWSHLRTTRPPEVTLIRSYIARRY